MVVDAHGWLLCAIGEKLSHMPNKNLCFAYPEIKSFLVLVQQCLGFESWPPKVMKTEASLLHWALGRSFAHTSHLRKLVVSLAVPSPTQKRRPSWEQVCMPTTSLSLLPSDPPHSNPHYVVNRHTAIKDRRRDVSTNMTASPSPEISVPQAQVWLSGRPWCSGLLCCTQSWPGSHHSDQGLSEFLRAETLLRVTCFRILSSWKC